MYTDDLFGGRPPVPGFPSRNPVDELAVSVRKNAADIAGHAANAGAHVTAGEKAAWNAKADLVGGKVPQEQLPSYVDDVLEYAATSSFPQAGETGKIYVDTSTGRTYRWSGSGYVQIGGEEQVQADWAQIDASAASFIKNKPTIPAAVSVDSALSGSSENPVQNKVVTAALNGKATAAQGAKADAALSRAEAVAGFTEWVCTPALPDGWELAWFDGDETYGWCPKSPSGFDGNVEGNAISTNLVFDGEEWGSGSGYAFTATRTRLPTMADIPTDNAQLTNGAGYATTTAMNTALAGKADASALPYALVDVPVSSTAYAPQALFPIKFEGTQIPFVIECGDTNLSITAQGGGYVLSWQSGYNWAVATFDGNGNFVQEGSDVDSGTLRFGAGEHAPTSADRIVPPNTAPLTDRAINAVSLTAAATLTMPAVSVAGHARDLVVRLTVGAADLNITWGTSDADGVAVDYETEDGAFPDLSAAGTYLVRLTETAAFAAGTGGAADVPAKFLIQCQELQTAVAGGGQ